MKWKLLTVAILVSVFAGGYWLLRMRSYSYELTGATYEEASRASVVRAFLSPHSSNVTAWIQPHRMNVTAAFDIPEAEFLAWAAKNGWQLQQIEDVAISNISRTGDPNDSVKIRDGWLYEWVYNDDDPGSTFRICAYDRMTGTGFFTQLGD